jgi:hypothetical protein
VLAPSVIFHYKKGFVSWPGARLVGALFHGHAHRILLRAERSFMWKQTDKPPFRDVTINYFKGS